MGRYLETEKGHNQEAEWLRDLKNELENEEHLQESVVISIEQVRKQCRKCPTGKLQGRMVFKVMNKILMGEDSPPAWMTYGRTVLCQKDPRRGNVAENYRPITSSASH